MDTIELILKQILKNQEEINKRLDELTEDINKIIENLAHE